MVGSSAMRCCSRNVLRGSEQSPARNPNRVAGEGRGGPVLGILFTEGAMWSIVAIVFGLAQIAGICLGFAGLQKRKQRREDKRMPWREEL